MYIIYYEYVTTPGRFEADLSRWGPSYEPSWQRRLISPAIKLKRQTKAQRRQQVKRLVAAFSIITEALCMYIYYRLDPYDDNGRPLTKSQLYRLGGFTIFPEKAVETTDGEEEEHIIPIATAELVELDKNNKHNNM